jgi:sensor histidine kinase YesM
MSNLFDNKWKVLVFKQFRDLLFALLLSIAITYLFMGKQLFHNFNVFSKNILFGFFLATLLWKGNQFIEWFNDWKFSWKRKPKLTLTMDILISVTYTIIVIFAVYYLFFKNFFQLNHQIKMSNYLPQMLITLIVSLLITVFFYLFHFFKWWRISTLNEAKLQQETIQLRYDALKSQVNPHFLFNSLSVLSSLVDTDTQKAKEFIQQFSNIYRYVLEHRESELVPLSEEVSFIKSFTNLHLVRHGENLRVSIDVDDSSGFIIPLSLQILLENCFKHNIISEEKPLTVRVWRENDYIIVQNNFQKRNTIHESGGIGLDTISKRYEYLSEKPIQIEQNGEVYRVKVPVLSSI